MEFLTGVVASGFIYDILKAGLTVTAENIKSYFRGYLIDEILATELENHISSLNINSDLSESAIEKRIGSSKNLMNLLSSIKHSSQTVVNQNHSGSGDNVAGHKIIN